MRGCLPINWHERIDLRRRWQWHAQSTQSQKEYVIFIDIRPFLWSWSTWFYVGSHNKRKRTYKWWDIFLVAKIFKFYLLKFSVKSTEENKSSEAGTVMGGRNILCYFPPLTPTKTEWVHWNVVNFRFSTSAQLISSSSLHLFWYLQLCSRFIFSLYPLVQCVLRVLCV